MKRITCLLACTFITIATFAQKTKLNELTVDRPGVAETPFTVPKGMYQFEVGFDYFKRYNGEIYNLPIVLFRAGITNGAELRLSTKQLLDKTEAVPYNEISPLSVGVKLHLLKQNHGIPEMDLLTNLIVPIGPSVPTKNLGPEFLLLFQNDFYPNTAINYNAGVYWDHVRQRNYFYRIFLFQLPAK
ncbi:MAG: hypothetical protein WDN75_04015 [Bacteroidota bacterium]